jgi:hypothetical protein
MCAFYFFLLTMLSSQYAFAKNYTVSLREFGFGRANCADDISGVANNFASHANVTILSSVCLPSEIGREYSTGQFKYVSAQAVNTISSDVRDAYIHDGYYHTVAECELALESERSLFIQQTGIEPYVGYCYKSNSVGSPRFRARLDAVGISKVAKHSTSASWMYKAVNETDLVSDVEAMVEALSGQVVAAMVDREIGGYLVVIDYYHENEFSLHSQTLLNWETGELCQTRADALNQQWDAEVRSAFHCTVNSSGNSQLLQVYLSTNILGGFDFDTDILATAYQSAEVCSSDIARIKTALEQSGTKVLGLTCGQEKNLNSWQMAVFSRSE